MYLSTVVYEILMQVHQAGSLIKLDLVLGWKVRLAIQLGVGSYGWHLELLEQMRH